MSSAKPLKLIPLDLYKKLLAIHVQGGTGQATELTSVVPTSETLIVDSVDQEDGERQDSIDSIIQMMPKTYRRKARIILEAGNIPFQRNSLRVQYPDGELGSHLLDVLQYVLSPAIIRTKQKSVPIDLDKFIEMLKSKPAIPRSMYGNVKVRARRSVKEFTWLTVK